MKISTASVTLLILVMVQTSWAQSSNQSKVIESEQSPRMGMYNAVMCEFSSADGQTKLAESYARKALTLLEDPSDDYEFYAKGVAYEALVNYDLALANFDQAIQYNPQKVVAYIRRGRVYSKKGNFDRALANLDKAIELEGQNAAGSKPLNKADYDVSSATIQSLIQSDPRPWLDYFSPGAAYLERGKTYLLKDDNVHAIADFTKVIELDPKGAHAYNHRGVAYVNQGDFDRAIADFDKAIELDPRLRNAHSNRGSAFSQKGDQARARADFDEETQLYPHDDSPIVMDQNSYVLNGHAVKLAKPKYPKAARKTHAAGLVVVHVLVDEQGTVINARAVSGDPLLYEASVEAAKNSLFTPTLLAGQAVKVTGVIQYNFVAK